MHICLSTTSLRVQHLKSTQLTVILLIRFMDCDYNQSRQYAPSWWEINVLRLQWIVTFCGFPIFRIPQKMEFYVFEMQLKAIFTDRCAGPVWISNSIWNESKVNIPCCDDALLIDSSTRPTISAEFLFFSIRLWNSPLSGTKSLKWRPHGSATSVVLWTFHCK